MRALLLRREVAIPDFHHIHVIVSVEVDVGEILRVRGKDGRDVRPGGTAVSGHSP